MKNLKGFMSVILACAMAMALSVTAFAASSTMTIQNTLADGSTVDAVTITNITSKGIYGVVGNGVDLYTANSSVTLRFLRNTNNRVEYECAGTSMDDYEKWVDTGKADPQVINLTSNKVVLSKAGIYDIHVEEPQAPDSDYTYGTEFFLIINLQSVTAMPTSSGVTIDGKTVPFTAYNINRNNYFKIRDLAMALTGTSKQFQVVYDKTLGGISIKTGSAYTPVGGELAAPAGSTASVTAKLSTYPVYVNGVKTDFVAYTINGNNYFKLRDVAAVIDFGVNYNTSTKTIVVDTSTGYTASPLSDNTVLANGTTLGDAKKIIDSTREYLQNLGYTDSEITLQLEELAGKMGTTLNTIESLEAMDKN